VINHVADIYERESGDAWYTHSAEDFVTAGLHVQGLRRATNGPRRVTFSTFGSTAGTSSVAVLENREELRWPADVYIEGGDQFRGWFNSSLMIGIALTIARRTTR
jgi:isoleucyl-tRNA synthetase